MSASFFASQRAKSDLVVHEVKPLTQLSETMLKMHGGRASISGVTATVFGASGFVSRYLCNRLGMMSLLIVSVSFRPPTCTAALIPLHVALRQVVLIITYPTISLSSTMS